MYDHLGIVCSELTISLDFFKSTQQMAVMVG
ncbi:MAG: hypothetical protein ACJAYE_003716 [Candidatus Azotimanducaceae bacterium]|jgi:hypothetical protein